MIRITKKESTTNHVLKLNDKRNNVRIWVWIWTWVYRYLEVGNVNTQIDFCK